MGEGGDATSRGHGRKGGDDEGPIEPHLASGGAARRGRGGQRHGPVGAVRKTEPWLGLQEAGALRGDGSSGRSWIDLQRAAKQFWISETCTHWLVRAEVSTGGRSFFLSRSGFLRRRKSLPSKVQTVDTQDREDAACLRG